MLLCEIAAVGSGRVDRANGRIERVKLLGVQSKNGRTYSPQALADVARLANNARVNVDHAEAAGSASYRNRIGKIVDAHVQEGGVYGTLLVNMGHSLADQLFYDAENSPDSVGLSIDATGETSTRNGRVIVERVSALRSVDLVAEPGTVGGLFECLQEHKNAAASSPLQEVRQRYREKFDRTKRLRETRRRQAENRPLQWGRLTHAVREPYVS